MDLRVWGLRCRCQGLESLGFRLGSGFGGLGGLLGLCL